MCLISHVLVTRFLKRPFETATLTFKRCFFCLPLIVASVTSQQLTVLLWNRKPFSCLEPFLCTGTISYVCLLSDWPLTLPPPPISFSIVFYLLYKEKAKRKQVFNIDSFYETNLNLLYCRCFWVYRPRKYSTARTAFAYVTYTYSVMRH